jgi:acyl-[acyl-carrier-protein]-phospholipid O-acyltransferase / long-chain-fatty-acid--[acyl-carrier-protein] ligase
MLMSGGKLLAAAIVMRRLLIRLGVVTRDQQMIGILLPPSVGAVLANVGVGLAGKVAVNLNYSFSGEGVSKCIDQCEISHVLSSRTFLKRRPFELHVETVYLEDLATQSTWLDRIVAAVQAYLLPLFVLERLAGVKQIKDDHVMTVLFTSGTTGDPKGVMLSQRNIASSVHAIDELFRVDKNDVCLGILPFFHAFGYSATLWLALALDMAAVYHFDPFATNAIGELARKHRATLLFATPTFLRLYLRRIDASDFASLDLAIVGAEKLDPELAAKFAKKFNASPVEGYGTTELSPWASVNVPLHRALAGAITQNKLGTVGRPVPGVDVKVVDRESSEVLATGEEGLLLVHGPNVMLGYLNRPDKTDEVIQNGWYNTGDLARCDKDGFITITGRQTRFSKIGGEIVPHEKLEQAISQIAFSDSDSSNGVQVAVTAIPDEAKGERLVVIHHPFGGLDASEIVKRLGDAGLPHLWLPKPVDFIEVEELPMTSLGKVDLGALKRIASKRSANAP